MRLLKQMVARREVAPVERDEDLESEEDRISSNHVFLHEVREIIHLPEFNGSGHKLEKDFGSVEIDPAIVDELRDYVTCVASMYRDNAFHNFEHGMYSPFSPVCTSTQVLLALPHPIAAPLHVSFTCDDVSSQASFSYCVSV